MDNCKILINGITASAEDWEQLKAMHKAKTAHAMLKTINYIQNGKMMTAYNIITK